MPRGVYNRKAKKEESNTSEAPKVKRKYTKRAQAPVVEDTCEDCKQEVASDTSTDGDTRVKVSKSDLKDTYLFDLSSLTSLLNTLCGLQNAGHSIVTPLIEKTAKALNDMLTEAYGREEKEEEEVEKSAPEIVERAVTSLPIPEKFLVPPPPSAS